MNVQTIRWGIIGTGRIARAFAYGLKFTKNGKLCAIASRGHESAKDFAQEWDIPLVFGSYQDLAESTDIDAVYIATPHSSHAENSILCMQNGKAVLCEKPLAVNAREVESMIKVSKNKVTLSVEIDRMVLNKSTGDRWWYITPMQNTTSKNELNGVKSFHPMGK